MARNRSVFEVMVGSVYGKYLAPLEEGEPDLEQAIYVEGPYFLKNHKYPVKLDSVDDGQYNQGEVVASIRFPKDSLLVGHISIKDLSNYVLVDQEEIFSRFPEELTLREERSPNLPIRHREPTPEQKKAWDAEPQI